MVVQPKQPCGVRYRRREARAARRVAANGLGATTTGAVRIRLDVGLCQGHAVCMSEAPDVFRVDEGAQTVTVLRYDVPAEQRERVARAVKHCPTRALSLEPL
jgi:sterol 14-demethylase